MRFIAPLIVFVLLTSCYKTLSLDGFDKSEWVNFSQKCSEYRLETVSLLLENQELLLSSTQNEIESLLGKANEHELYERNQKFFHYYLTPDDSCGVYEVYQNLSVRFNAIGRVSEVLITSE